MKLSCVTATFNCIKAGNRESLVRCIESVAKIRTEHEHLVYDGASKDGTAELLRELEKSTPGLKVVSEPDTGIYSALNKGVRDAKGEWFYVLGADDFVERPEVLDEIAAEGDCDAIATPVATGNRMRCITLENIFCSSPYCHQGVLQKTELVRQYGGFDESYRIAADYDLMLKFHEDARTIKYLDRPFAFFGDRGFSSTCDDEIIREVAIICAAHFGVTMKTAERMAFRHDVPLSFEPRYSSHPDYAFRVAARHVRKAYFKNILRKIFWPAVLIRRHFIRKRRGF